MPGLGRTRLPFVGHVGKIALLSTILSPVAASPALAQAIKFGTDGSIYFEPLQVAALSAFISAICIAVVSAAALIRARRMAEEDRERLLRENADLKLAADRTEAALNADDQRTVIWGSRDEAPKVMGSLPEASGVPRSQVGFLAFGQWLEPASAQLLEARTRALRTDGEAFLDVLTTTTGVHIEAAGRVNGSRCFIRFRNLTRERQQYAELAERFERQRTLVETFEGLIDKVPMPAWTRDKSGRLVWVNAAYARAVEVASATQAVAVGAEFLDTAARKAITDSRQGAPVFEKRLSVVVGGARRVFDVVDVETASGSAGIATDVSELEQAQVELRRTIDSHARTLDQLATAVAIFGADKRLKFYNAAYRSLFDLDTAFLESGPDDAAVLDQLRVSRKLPEQADFRTWKREQLAAYQAMEARESWWHLPTGQTLRVIANPHPQGGVTYVYENVTEQIELKSRYNALTRVQGETLDHLSEGVAVFGSDGRLRLSNPAFGSLWKLSDEMLAGRPHINDVVGHCMAAHGNREAWDQVRLAVAGLADSRNRLTGRLDRRDGGVIDFTTVPLPDGATLITFVNVTDSVNVERALTEKNEALEEADQLKNAFIQHVSYELRSPLTNIIGFAQLLADDNAGPLNIKQREYTGYIMDSSTALLAIINDILDLATVDAGIMELELGSVDIPMTVGAATTGLRDRIAEAHIDLKLDVPEDIGSFVADEKRIRQVLYNLLSNAIAFSDDGGSVSLSCRRTGEEISFTVEDHGRGIPDEYLQAVFERFESRTNGARRRGPGLGLSIVKSFVELHKGNVEITSKIGVGTRVVCRLPINPSIAEAAE
ncbi:PAS-domain containing protein [Pleomorphomonas sp. NRK KF1]|uniref:PAS domain-containing sensor histidine kinase n=1 Tax=Pleomorphomonas sp. NRK KF1 TaxID=2943000 RepID=UPI002043CDFB|nr:PAS-domain containing protein [Pleomorphomonas sp. NRK KF1]MCM5555991.1 PAS-domain containing protein [Pleomorphomonas sp. NRK KF1]